MKTAMPIMLIATISALGCEGNQNTFSPDMDASLYAQPGNEHIYRVRVDRPEFIAPDPNQFPPPAPPGELPWMEEDPYIRLEVDGGSDPRESEASSFGLEPGLLHQQPMAGSAGEAGPPHPARSGSGFEVEDS